MMQRNELIAALERATGPDRELDLRIHDAVYGALSFSDLSASDGALPLHYTASIEAALSLFDKSYIVTLNIDDGHKTASVMVHRDTKHAAIAATWDHPPAIALCIAALKAQETRAMTDADVLRARAENIVATMIGDPQVFGNLTDAIAQALLASHDAGLEQAAKVAEDCMAHLTAETIRALKTQPNEKEKS